MLAQKIAGWAKRVLSSTRRNGSSPTSSPARSRRSGASRATWSRISGVWLPWPGKSTAGACVSVTKLTQHTLGGPPASSVGSAAPTPRVGGQAVRDGGCRRGGRRPGSGCGVRSTALGSRSGRSLRLGDEADALGLLHGLRPVARAELAIQRGGVLLDRVRRQEEALGDLAVGGARRHRLEHLTLALGQRG